MHPNSVERSAFSTPKGLFEFLVMPFGLKTASAIFQRMMKTKVLQSLEEFTDAYIDDVEIDSSTVDEHLCRLERVLARLRKFNLKARPSKCKIAMPTVNFISHKVGSNSIQPRSILVSAIDKFPRPKTKTEVRKFIGIASYYRRYIRNFAEHALPLTDLTRGKSAKSSEINWTSECQSAFQFLKEQLKSSPILVPPSWDKEFLVQVDASNRGIGAVLAQHDSSGNEHPICYLSRKLKPSEEILSTSEKECLALV